MTIPLFTVFVAPEEELMPALHQVLYSGYIGQGPKVAEFESVLADYIGNRNVLTVNSGTSALQLALRLIGVEGGEVITTPMTCTATNMPILAERARIVWADIDPATGNIDPTDVERKITANTKAILAVHWGGNPADLDALGAISKRYGIPLIEDAAHALGARWRGRRLGNQTADYTIYSLQAIKHVTTVDGGVLVVRDSEQYRRGKLLRWYGIDRETDRKDFRCEEDIAEWGYKFHMNDVTATIGLAQFKYLDDVVAAHQANAVFYRAHIRGVDIPFAHPAATPSWWLYTVRLSCVAERLDFMAHMQSKGVAVSQVHARNDTHTCFREFQRSPLPGVDRFTERMCCIPVHWRLSEGERLAISAAVASWRA